MFINNFQVFRRTFAAIFWGNLTTYSSSSPSNFRSALQSTGASFEEKTLPCPPEPPRKLLKNVPEKKQKYSLARSQVLYASGSTNSLFSEFFIPRTVGVEGGTLAMACGVHEHWVVCGALITDHNCCAFFISRTFLRWVFGFVKFCYRYWGLPANSASGPITALLSQ